MDKDLIRKLDEQVPPKERPLPAHNTPRDIKTQGQPKEKPAPANLPPKK